MTRGGVRRSLAAPLVAIGLAGCSSLGPNSAGAGEAALAFHTAHEEGDGGQACELLTDAVRTELEQSAEQPCDEAILMEDLPTAGRVMEVAAYGGDARVILDGDVVFVTVEGGQWKVSAAGCEFRSNLPYDCTLTGS